MGIRNTPQQRKAVGYLRRLVSRRKPGDRLPTVAELGRVAGVSHVTVWKAVRRLVEAGTLTAVHRGGIHVRAAVAGEGARLPAPAQQHSTRHWEKVCAGIEADILRGVYSHGRPLPSHKELALGCGACYRTIKRALRELERRGSVVAYGRTYEIVPFSSRHRPSRVALIAAAGDDGTVRLVASWTQEQLRAMEQECSRLGIGMEVLAWDRQAAASAPLSRSGQALRELCGGAATLGAMVWTAGFSGGVTAGVLGWLRPCGKPVAVLDADEDQAYACPSGTGRGVWVYRAADSVAAGRAVGRYLLSLGHRRIAYVSPVHGISWSRRRLEGLAGAARDAGIADGVVPCVIDRYSYRTQFVQDDENALEKVRAVLAKGAAGVRRSESAVAGTLQAMYAEAMGVMKRVLLRRRLAPLFEQAFGSGATAWVACNDETAIEALTVLRERGSRVPQDVSVTGFDDSPDAFAHKLTSYNFNTVAAVRPMLDFILAPRLAGSRRATQPVVVVDGFVSERSTAAKPAPGQA